MGKYQKSPQKEDKSVHIEQRPKIKSELHIREYRWTPKQLELINLILDKKTKIVIIEGCAGTSKTLTSVFCGLKLLNEKKIQEIVYIRSLIQAKDGETGYLQGDLKTKTQDYNVPLFDKLNELLPKSEAHELINDERIRTIPTSMIRGYQFSVSLVIADECQNYLLSSLITIATRLGEHSKLIILADRVQNDLGKTSGFDEFFNIFNDQESKDNGIHTFKFDSEDVLRSGIVKFVVQKMEKHRQQKVNKEAEKDWTPSKSKKSS